MRRLLPVLTTLLALLTACSAETPTGGPTSSATGTATASKSPSTSAKPKPRVPTAQLAVYAAGDALWMYDVKEDSVSSVARGSRIRDPKFLTETQISFVQNAADEADSGSTLRVIDLKTQEIRDVLTVDTGISVYGWSPDRKTLAYVTTDQRGYPHVIFRDAENIDAVRPIGTLARAFGRGAHDSDQLKIEWSRDGQMVAIVYTYADGSEDGDVADDQSQLQIRLLDGSLVHAAAHETDPTMAEWAPDGRRLYYRTTRGGRYWSAENSRVSALPGRPAWFNPWISPDGKLIAYDTGLSTSGVRIRLYDLARGRSRALSPSGRIAPVFVDAKTVWAQKVRRCSDCQSPNEPVSQVVAIDVSTRRERAIALKQTLGIDVFYK